MKLLSLVAVFFAVLPVSADVIKHWPPEMPLICQFFLRRGHMYLHHTDDRQGKIYEGIAVFVDVNEIVFGPLPFENARNKTKRKTSRILFQTARGPQEADNYFFIIADRYKLVRKKWADGYGKCNMVQFHYSVPVLIKKDLEKKTSPKFVGTYNIARDILYYSDENEERIVYNDMKKMFDTGYYNSSYYEVLCVTKR